MYCPIPAQWEARISEKKVTGKVSGTGIHKEELSIRFLTICEAETA